jgi:uncharacterized phage protein (TIGR02220 family)
MSKRFTQTDIWDEDWYLDMPKEYKLFWFYLKDQCNHAGIWKPNIRLFNAIIGCKIDLNKALVFFNNGKERISVLNSGHWFINDFFVFQYGGTFNPQNRVHKSIECVYNHEGIVLTSIRGLKEVKDEDKGEDKDRVKDKDIYINKEDINMYSSFLNLFNSLTERNFKGTDRDKRQFNARIKEGFTIDDFEKAILACLNDKYHKENPQYLTPEFITRADKLQKYLNAGTMVTESYMEHVKNLKVI